MLNLTPVMGCRIGIAIRFALFGALFCFRSLQAGQVCSALNAAGRDTRAERGIVHAQRKALLGDETHRSTFLLSIDEVDAVVEERRMFGGHECRIFDKPVTRAVRSGYQVTNFGLFEKSPNGFSEEVAAKARELLEAKFPRAELTVLEPFCGIGQDTWSFVKTGFTAQASDADPLTAQAAKHNLALAGAGARAYVEARDATELLPTMVRAKNRFGLVYLDPPWQRGVNRDRAMKFSDYEPNLEALIVQGLEVAPLVAVKVASRNISVDEIVRFAVRFQLLVEVYEDKKLQVVFFWRV